MKAYVELIQRRERELGTDVLTHQRVGPSYSRRYELMLTLYAPTVEWCGLRRQPPQDRYWWCFLDGSDGRRCHRVAICREAVIVELILYQHCIYLVRVELCVTTVGSGMLLSAIAEIGLYSSDLHESRTWTRPNVSKLPQISCSNLPPARSTMC